MDNAAFHKKDEIIKIAEEFGHDVLFLPPYSPDLNPIEQDFAIMKKKASSSKSVGGWRLWQAAHLVI